MVIALGLGYLSRFSWLRRVIKPSMINILGIKTYFHVAKLVSIESPESNHSKYINLYNQYTYIITPWSGLAAKNILCLDRNWDFMIIF